MKTLALLSAALFFSVSAFASDFYKSSTALSFEYTNAKTGKTVTIPGDIEFRFDTSGPYCGVFYKNHEFSCRHTTDGQYSMIAVARQDFINLTKLVVIKNPRALEIVTFGLQSLNTFEFRMHYCGTGCRFYSAWTSLRDPNSNFEQVMVKGQSESPERF